MSELNALTIVSVLVLVGSIVMAGHLADLVSADPASSTSSGDNAEAPVGTTINFHVSAQPGNNTATLTWSESFETEGKVYYKIQVRDQVEDPNFVTVGCFIARPPANPVGPPLFDTSSGLRCLSLEWTPSYSHTVKNLTNGIEYEFLVEATGPEHSRIIPNTASATVKVTPGVLPGSPPEFLGLPLDGGAILSWAVPDNGGSPITEYVIAARIGTVNPFDTVATVQGHPDTYTVENLTNGVPYEFVVFARNGIGDGPPSDSITLTPTGEPYCIFFCN